MPTNERQFFAEVSNLELFFPRSRSQYSFKYIPAASSFVSPFTLFSDVRVHVWLAEKNLFTTLARTINHIDFGWKRLRKRMKKGKQVELILNC